MATSYEQALRIALDSSGADESTLSAWEDDLRRADGDLDGAIAAAVRSGDSELAQMLADRGAALQAIADFIERLREELARPQ